jgi:transposase
MFIRKNRLTLQSVTVPDVIQKRQIWNEKINEYDVNNLVFIDESGVNTNMVRLYGRAMRGNRSVDNTSLNTPKNTTILSSIRLNGETAYTTYQGGTTKDKFIDYLKNVLAPTLDKNDIVIMDNMRTHHAKDVQKVVKELKMNVIFLPPYSPDFNPIEKMWSKIKSILRKLRSRTLTELSESIKQAFSKITVSDCYGWFSSYIHW